MSVPNQSLDYNNIMASCNTKEQCGIKRGSKPLPLTPFMQECETELEFYISGNMKGLSERAQNTLEILNLANKKLWEARKRLFDSLIFKRYGRSVEGLELFEDEELLKLSMAMLERTDNGKLSPFAPVFVNIMRNWLKNKGQ